MSDLTDFDQKFFRDHDVIAGMDEAGRGALAGPVFVGCLASEPDGIAEEETEEVNDSKQLTGKSRSRLFDFLTSADKIRIGIGRATSDEIDELGINPATSLAASRALNGVSVEPELLLLDKGLKLPGEISSRTLEKGDERSFHVAGASVLAKVARDRYMWAQAGVFPDYGWESNVGYGTKEHRKALKKRGPTPLHRKSFTVG